MKIELQINPNITQLEQMARQLKLRPVDNCLQIPPSLGDGFLRYYALPYQIQVHHYQYRLQQKIAVHGINREEEGLYMIHINLSNRVLTKNIGSTQKHLSETGKSGVLFYSPGYDSQGSNDIGQSYEVVFFAFPQSTWKQLGASVPQHLPPQGRFCVYNELPLSLEQSLQTALNTAASSNAFIRQGQLLEVLGQIIHSFAERKYRPNTKLNLQDVERQFQVKEILLSHLFGQPPTIETLAAKVHISPSKLKADFKSLFGNSVYQYYLARKMEIAKELVSQRAGTIAEIGYRLGYSNIAQFSAQFKKHHGHNPSQLPK